MSVEDDDVELKNAALGEGEDPRDVGGVSSPQVSVSLLLLMLVGAFSELRWLLMDDDKASPLPLLP